MAKKILLVKTPRIWGIRPARPKAIAQPRVVVAVNIFILKIDYRMAHRGIAQQCTVLGRGPTRMPKLSRERHE